MALGLLGSIHEQRRLNDHSIEGPRLKGMAVSKVTASNFGQVGPGFREFPKIRGCLQVSIRALTVSEVYDTI